MPCLRFHSFTLDLDRYELSEGGQSIHLPRTAMELLILLVSQRGNLLSRQQIVAALWPGRGVEPVAASLNTAVNRLREALRDESARPAFIQTAIGKGYRFIADVEETQDSAAAAAQPPSLEELYAWYTRAAPLEVSRLRLDTSTVVFTLRGALVLGPGLKLAEGEMLAELLEAARHVVLNLAAVTRMDSAGLGFLVHLLGFLGESGGVLRVCNAPTPVLRLLRMTKTDTLFALDADVQASLARLIDTGAAPA